MNFRRPSFRFARFDDVRSQGLRGWYAVVDGEPGRTHIAQSVFLPGLRDTSRPKLLIEVEPEAAEVTSDIDRRSSWTGPFATIEEAREEGRRLVG